MKVKKATNKELKNFLNWVFDSIDYYTKLANITKQSSNIGLGYLSQMLVSLITGIPGNSSGSNGDDLNDGSEVKSAFMDFRDDRSGNTLSKDLARYNKLDTAGQAPNIFLVRWEIDRKYKMVCVTTPSTNEFRKIRKRYLKMHSSKNLQLHPFWNPPLINVVTNSAGIKIKGLPRQRPKGLELKVLLFANRKERKSWRINKKADAKNLLFVTKKNRK